MWQETGILEYKGYYTHPRYSSDDEVFWGKLDGISDSISFEGTSVCELQAAFIEAVDDYLDTCQRNGMTPKSPFTGRIESNLQNAPQSGALLKEIKPSMTNILR